MGIDGIESRRQELARNLRSSFDGREKQRRDQLEKIENEGVLKAAGTLSAVRRVAHMTVAEGRMFASRRSLETGKVNETTFEAILDGDDSDHINFMLRGHLASRAVCRLAVGSRAVGTGFLIAPGLLLTNNHVIESPEDAQRFTAEFDYELDLQDQPRSPIVRFSLDPSRLFVTSHRDRLDFTIVAVRERSLRDEHSIEEFGWIPLDDRIDKILVGEPALIIQHPRGEHKRVCVFSAELVDKLDEHLHYTTDTDGGSSGSGVFNRSWQLVALHHAAVQIEGHHRGRPRTANEGIRVSSILRALNTGDGVDAGVDGDRVDDREAILRIVTDPALVRDGRPQSPSGARSALGLPQPAERTAVSRSTPEARGTVIRRKPKDHFDHRAGESFGYKPSFLGSIAVPMPGLPRSLAEDVTTTEEGESELRYTHYSVVMSASRRLPLLTAVNINGARSQRLARTDRDFEAADVWSYDPRIPEDAQLGPEVYDRTDFDYGHMVRREDPVWGDDNTCRMANDDTFYMTNCAPQHNSLNTRTWQTLENAILESARDARRKVSVFTGPVLRPDDPEILEVQVPLSFWKIVAYMEGGALKAHGFVQSQAELVDGLKVRPEAFADGLQKAEAYQVPIREIARMTSLDFGPLLAADSLRSRGREVPRRRRLDESLIDSLLRPSREGGEEEREAPLADRKPVGTFVVERPLHLPSRGNEGELVDAIRSLQRTLARYLERAATNGAPTTTTDLER